MDWYDWLGDNYEQVKAVIRKQGIYSHVWHSDLEDFTSRVFLRALSMNSRPRNEKSSWAFIKAIAMHQALDDMRRRKSRPDTVNMDQHPEPWAHNPYSELEFLSTLRHLSVDERRAVIGHALGYKDRELANFEQTLHSVTKRRERAKTKIRRY